MESTLRQARCALPGCRFVGFYDDNPFGERDEERWQWREFLNAVSCYDVLLVKRRSDVTELSKLGAKRVELFMHGYFDGLFHPGNDELNSGHDISFVGTALDHRVAFIAQLLKRESIPVQVYGNKWNRTSIYHTRRSQFHPSVLGRDYAEVLRRSGINLAFVSSSNRDEYTMRTFEIPACRGFMLAERTSVHTELFREGVEAEFFDSVEECASKARYYLQNGAARRRIASAGYERCVTSDYSLRRRIADALHCILS